MLRLLVGCWIVVVCVEGPELDVVVDVSVDEDEFDVPEDDCGGGA